MKEEATKLYKKAEPKVKEAYKKLKILEKLKEKKLQIVTKSFIYCNFYTIIHIFT